MDYFKVIDDARLKPETGTAPAMPYIEKKDSRGEPQAIVTSIEASEQQSDSENTGACGKVKRQHMDHIAEKRCVESFHCGLVHKAVSIPAALKIPEAQTAGDEQCNKLKTIPAWDVKKVRSMSEVIRQAKKDGTEFTSRI